MEVRVLLRLRGVEIPRRARNDMGRVGYDVERVRDYVDRVGVDLGLLAIPCVRCADGTGLARNFVDDVDEGLVAG